MKVLLLDDAKRGPDGLRLLTSLGHSVVLVEDAPAALRRLERGDVPEALVTKWPLQGRAGLMQKLRGSDGAPYVYVVGMLDTVTPVEVGALYDAGVDDFVRRPMLGAELAGRLGTPERMRRALGGPSAAEPAADARAAKVASLLAFSGAGALVADALSGMVGPLSCEDAEIPASPSRAASVVLSLAADEVELYVSLFLEKESSASFATDLCGDPDADDAALDDMMRELANMAGGAVKTAALGELVVFTSSLPRNDLGHADSPVKRKCWWARRADGAGRIGVIASVCGSKNQRLPATKLREGMVVVRDLRTRLGALIVAAGTRLTSSSAERLPKLLGDDTLIDVAVLAA